MVVFGWRFKEYTLQQETIIHFRLQQQKQRNSNSKRFDECARAIGMLPNDTKPVFTLKSLVETVVMLVMILYYNNEAFTNDDK